MSTSERTEELQIEAGCFPPALHLSATSTESQQSVPADAPHLHKVLVAEAYGALRRSAAEARRASPWQIQTLTRSLRQGTPPPAVNRSQVKVRATLFSELHVKVWQQVIAEIRSRLDDIESVPAGKSSSGRNSLQTGNWRMNES